MIDLHKCQEALQPPSHPGRATARGSKLFHAPHRSPSDHSQTQAPSGGVLLMRIVVARETIPGPGEL